MEESSCSKKKSETTKFVHYLEEKAMKELNLIQKINFMA